MKFAVVPAAEAGVVDSTLIPVMSRAAAPAEASSLAKNAILSPLWLRGDSSFDANFLLLA